MCGRVEEEDERPSCAGMYSTQQEEQTGGEEIHCCAGGEGEKMADDVLASSLHQDSELMSERVTFIYL